jgi:hypothetical protein
MEIMSYSDKQTPLLRHPARLPGSLWGITTFYNPVRYATKRANYRLFRESLRSQGLPLIAVEMVHDDAPFELDASDAEILVQRRGGAVLWQKERLLNVALEHLPTDCDKVVWVDADMLFQNRHWVADTAALLEQYAFVQPFSLFFRLSRGCSSLTDCKKSAFTAETSVAYSWSLRKGLIAGVHGGAMAARRSVLAEQGLYDRMILGSGDRIMMSVAMGIDPGDYPLVNVHPAILIADAREWFRRIDTAAHGSLFYTEGNLFHLWHGTVANRRYVKRARLLDGFNVHEDIRLDDQGLWSWSSDKPALHEGVRRYSLLRNEDGELPSAWRKRCIPPLKRVLSSLVPQRFARFCGLSNTETRPGTPDQPPDEEEVGNGSFGGPPR